MATPGSNPMDSKPILSWPCTLYASSPRPGDRPLESFMSPGKDSNTSSPRRNVSVVKPMKRSDSSKVKSCDHTKRSKIGGKSASKSSSSRGVSVSPQLPVIRSPTPAKSVRRVLTPGASDKASTFKARYVPTKEILAKSRKRKGVSGSDKKAPSKGFRGKSISRILKELPPYRQKLPATKKSQAKPGPAQQQKARQDRIKKGDTKKLSTTGGSGTPKSVDAVTHTCAICSRTFATRTRLLDHAISHSTERPFECQWCDMAFKWRRNRFRHEDICHTKQSMVGNTADLKKRPKVAATVPAAKPAPKTKNTAPTAKPAPKTKNTAPTAKPAPKTKNTAAAAKPAPQTKNTTAAAKPAPKTKARRPAPKSKDPTPATKPASMTKDPTATLVTGAGFGNKTHTDIMENIFQCESCPYAFFRRVDLVNHRLRHSSERPYHCGVCGATFKRLGDLSHHKRVHVCYEHICQLCGISYPNKHKLQKHTRDKHGGRKAPRVTAKSNVKAAHEDNIDKPGWRKRPSNATPTDSHAVVGSPQLELKSESLHDSHINEEAPYQCISCDRRFYDWHVLTQHMRIHDGEHPFRCIKDEERFVDDGEEFAHASTHHTEAVLTCNVCEDEFDHLINLEDHQKLNHGGDSSLCVIS